MMPRECFHLCLMWHVNESFLLFPNTSFCRAIWHLLQLILYCYLCLLRLYLTETWSSLQISRVVWYRWLSRLSLFWDCVNFTSNGLALRLHPWHISSKVMNTSFQLLMMTFNKIKIKILAKIITNGYITVFMLYKLYKI